jgi:hypothetical protein
LRTFNGYLLFFHLFRFGVRCSAFFLLCSALGKNNRTIKRSSFRVFEEDVSRLTHPPSFAMLMIGYHSRAGSAANPLAHTISGNIAGLKINEHYASELQMHAYAACRCPNNSRSKSRTRITRWPLKHPISREPN